MHVVVSWFEGLLACSHDRPRAQDEGLEAVHLPQTQRTQPLNNDLDNVSQLGNLYKINVSP